ncbi:hypothetical protein DM02DRAFT_41203 [Periconia macrospinosa]|uniref:Uncharacterized protein n=1 Tax=Periconia macrospinosa TaxID=97972 RepID=A0A2V1DLC2_9PLEO|nr:hypothetical protein DM02DRAFT_41203 [Periconia macrospinosa]
MTSGFALRVCCVFLQVVMTPAPKNFRLGMASVAPSAHRVPAIFHSQTPIPDFALDIPSPRVCLAHHFTAVHIVTSIDYLERSLRSRTMTDESRSKVIKANPIGKGLDTFRDSFEFKCRGLAITGADALYHLSGEGPKNSLLDLISALQVSLHLVRCLLRAITSTYLVICWS